MSINEAMRQERIANYAAKLESELERKAAAYAEIEAKVNEQPAANQATYTLDAKHGGQGWDLVYRARDGRWVCNIKGETSCDGGTITEALVNGAAFEPLPRFPRAPIVRRVEEFGEPFRDGSRWRYNGVGSSWIAKKRAVSAIAAMCQRSEDKYQEWERTTGRILDGYSGEGIDFRWER